MNRLMRSKEDKVFLGVCGGIANYFGIDSTLVRLIFAFFVLMSFGTAIFAYILAAFIIPSGDYDFSQDEEDFDYEFDERNAKIRERTPMAVGIGLILFGILMLSRKILPSFFYQFRRLFSYWPALLIILGLYVIIQNKKED